MSRSGVTLTCWHFYPSPQWDLQESGRWQKQDVTLQEVIKRIQRGLPENKKQIPLSIQHYFAFQDELSFQDGRVFRWERAIIPDALRADLIRRIHSSHLWVERCLRRGMNIQIKSVTCRSVDPKHQKEISQPHSMACRPWARMGTDLFSCDNKDYLITNFWEVDYLPYTKRNTVIHKLKAHFARQGIPDVLVSDNRPQYLSQEFQKWEYEHRTSCGKGWVSRQDGQTVHAIHIWLYWIIATPQTRVSTKVHHRGFSAGEPELFFLQKQHC